jgi:hypothetical protein
MAMSSTYSPSAADQPAAEEEIKRALQPLIFAYSGVPKGEVIAWIMVLKASPVWAIEDAVKAVVTGTDGRTMAEAAFAPKAPQLAMMARKIVEHEMIRRRSEEWKRLNPPKPVRAIADDSMADQQQIEAFRAKLERRIRRIA